MSRPAAALRQPGLAPYLTTVSFSPPNFTSPALASAPDAKFVAAPADGVLPEGFFSTTNLPTYARVKGDRKSTRLNSSHPSISYAVFCLKKKKKTTIERDAITPHSTIPTCSEHHM